MKHLNDYITEMNAQAIAGAAAVHWMNKLKKEREEHKGSSEKNDNKPEMHEVMVIVHNVSDSQKEIHETIKKLVDKKVILSVNSVSDWDKVKDSKNDYILIFNSKYLKKKCQEFFDVVGSDLYIDGNQIKTKYDIDKLK